VTERELIELLKSLASERRPPWLDVGIGDDAAELELGGGQKLVLTTDMVVAGIHFSPETEAELIARKAITRALSDLAAMAARPLCTIAAVSFGTRPDGAFCRRLTEALWRTAQEFSAPLVGGDIAAGGGSLTIAVTVIGVPGQAGVVTRAGARTGDAVCVTGSLGGSIRGRHLTFTPRVREALELAAAAELHAMIDISDGLSTDLLHIAEASGVAMEIEAQRVPISQDAVALSQETGRDPLWHALNDGEDYELAFCLDWQDADRLARRGVRDVVVSKIGTVIPAGESRLVTPDGKTEILRAGGWEHLSE